VAQDVTEFLKRPVVLPEGVLPLNAGFFALERMRENDVALRREKEEEQV
jgi:hypothetical protein